MGNNNNNNKSNKKENITKEKETTKTAKPTTHPLIQTYNSVLPISR